MKGLWEPVAKTKQKRQRDQVAQQKKQKKEREKLTSVQSSLKIATQQLHRNPEIGLFFRSASFVGNKQHRRGIGTLPLSLSLSPSILSTPSILLSPSLSRLLLLLSFFCHRHYHMHRRMYCVDYHREKYSRREERTTYAMRYRIIPQGRFRHTNKSEQK